MKYFSLFSGIGWFELWIQQAFKKKNESLDVSTPTLREPMMMDVTERGTHAEQELLGTQQPHCVWFCELDKYASKVYQSHFPTHHAYGDVTKINADELPDFDLLVWWFPCQAFSVAGKRRGFEDTRGTLFFDVARILRAKRPRLLWLENVKGLLSHDNGRTFSTIIATLDDLGYDLQWQVLNSKNHWVPQNRERVFIVGHLRGTPRPEVFPFAGQGNENSTIGLTTETAIARTLTGGGHSGGNHSGMTIIQLSSIKNSNYGTQPIQNDRFYGTDWISPALASQLPWGSHKILDRPWIRRLTPIECERLQGFPNNWTSIVSDSQRYKVCWNAVTVNVIQDIAERLLFAREAI